MLRSVLVCLLVGILAACGQQDARPGVVEVVAAENVYGDIARQIGGDHVHVTSILTSPTADPHLYEPGTADGLAVARARVVVQNGLGYDAFMERLEDATPSDHREVVLAARFSRGNDANPHLWYDVNAIVNVALATANALSAVDAGNEKSYDAGLRRFDLSFAHVVERIRAIRAAHRGVAVAYTEAVPAYLVTDLGLRNLAPSSFTRPIEAGSEPSAGAVSAMLELVSKRRIRVLLYNTQAVSPVTARVRDAARDAGIPVVGVTETLPAGLTYQQWQLRQLDTLAEALAG